MPSHHSSHKSQSRRVIPNAPVGTSLFWEERSQQLLSASEFAGAKAIDLETSATNFTSTEEQVRPDQKAKPPTTTSRLCCDAQPDHFLLPTLASRSSATESFVMCGRFTITVRYDLNSSSVSN
jgi:hypothetical protein